MATSNILKAVNSSQGLEQTQLPVREVTSLLKKWFKNLDNPSPPEESYKKGKTWEDVHNYFYLLDEARDEILKSQSLCSLPSEEADLEKLSYTERLCSQNNPYDFAETFEKAVDEILNFENKIDPNKTFFLYYFHRRQLQDAASEKWFKTAHKIGKIWA